MTLFLLIVPNNLHLYNTSLIGQQNFLEIRSLSQRRCVFCHPNQLKTLLGTDHFWVTLDSSPLVEGHILIHSKSHIGCAGEVESETFLELLKQLEKANPSATENEKIAYVNNETTPSFKRRVVGALQAIGEAAIDEFILENKYLKVAKAAIKGWLQPGT